MSFVPFPSNSHKPATNSYEQQSPSHTRYGLRVGAGIALVAAVIGYVHNAAQSEAPRDVIKSTKVEVGMPAPPVIEKTTIHAILGHQLTAGLFRDEYADSLASPTVTFSDCTSVETLVSGSAPDYGYHVSNVRPGDVLHDNFTYTDKQNEIVSCTTATIGSYAIQHTESLLREIAGKRPSPVTLIFNPGNGQ
jgi:hypothetical protein